MSQNAAPQDEPQDEPLVLDEADLTLDAPLNHDRPPKRKKRELSGWLILDKPVGITSTAAVGRVKYLYAAKKAGHAGTLDPLASGLLPIAFGEATKTVPFVQDGDKNYLFTVRWGVATDSDDAEGAVIATSDKRPQVDAITALLPQFLGLVWQMPPTYSALKINGARAYDLARAGEEVVLEPRQVRIDALHLIDAQEDEAVFTARCGKGTYVRAIARDLGLLLGCYGHVTALRRMAVGPFSEADSVPLSALDEATPEQLETYLRPVHLGLKGQPMLQVDSAAASRLRQGQSMIVRGRDAPLEGMAYAMCAGRLVAFGEIVEGELVPSRVFHV